MSPPRSSPPVRPRIPSTTAWRQISAGSYLRGESTLIEGITRVAPGAWASISTKTAEVTHSHWHLPSARRRPRPGGAPERRSRCELTNVLEGTLREAVHGALLADTTVGTLCSGGVDSSLITALAVEVKPDLVAFGASYTADPRMDEGPAARRVAKALGIDLELVDVTPADFRRMFVSATVHYGVPIANASAVTVAQLADRARERGVKVVLTGEGADELFGGYGDLHAGRVGGVPALARDSVVHHAETMMLERPAPGSGARTPNGSKHLRGGLAVGRRHSAVSGLDARRCSPDTGHEPSPESTAALTRTTRGTGAGSRRRLLTRLDYTLCWLLNRMDKNVMQAVGGGARPVPGARGRKARTRISRSSARVGPWTKGILRDVARRVLPWSIAHRPKIYGMDFDCRIVDRRRAPTSELPHRRAPPRKSSRFPAAEFEQAMAAAQGLQKLRLWSAEVWCRSVLAGQSIQEIRPGDLAVVNLKPSRRAGRRSPGGPFRADFWRSPLRGRWLTSVLGLVLLIGLPIVARSPACSRTTPTSRTWAATSMGKARSAGSSFDPLAWPTQPSWLYAFTQGLHVAIGLALVPVLLAKLWSVTAAAVRVAGRCVAPRTRSSACRSILLVGSAIFEFVTGIIDIQLWVPFSFYFPAAHYYGGLVFIVAFVSARGAQVADDAPAGSKLRRELGMRLVQRSRASRTHGRDPRPTSGAGTVGGLAASTGRSNPRTPVAPTMSRRALLGTVAAGSALLLVQGAGESIGGVLRPLALPGPAQPHGLGPERLSGEPYGGAESLLRPERRRREHGGYVVVGAHTVSLTRPQLHAMTQHTYALPIACVEGWSTTQTLERRAPSRPGGTCRDRPARRPCKPCRRAQ